MTPVKPLEVAPPQNTRDFGQQGEVDVDVYVDAPPLKECIEYAKTKMQQMVLGVLVGDYCTWQGREFTWVRHFIPALKAVSASASCKLTKEAWEEVARIRAESYPQMHLVGWMQSHPGFGIYMSGMSLHIHESFFNLPWQVALTVDPQADKLGFFGWSKGEVKKTGFRTVSRQSTPRPTTEHGWPKRPNDW